jgi:hypothetical protein
VITFTLVLMFNSGCKKTEIESSHKTDPAVQNLEESSDSVAIKVEQDSIEALHDTIITEIEIINDLTRQECRIPMSQKISLDPGHSIFSYNSLRWDMNERYEEYCTKNGVEYTREESNKNFEEVIHHPIIQSFIGLDTLLNRRVEIYDINSGISCISRIKDFYWYHDYMGEDELRVKFPLTSAIEDTLSEVLDQIGLKWTGFSILSFLLPQDYYRKPDSVYFYQILNTPLVKREPIINDRPKHKALEHLASLDTTSFFAIDSLQQKKVLPGDVKGDVDYYEFKYSHYQNKDKINYSLIIQCMSDSCRVLAMGKHITPFKPIGKSIYEGFFSSGHKVSLTDFIDVDRNGIFEIGIYKTYDTGNDFPAVWSRAYHDFSGRESKCIWGESGGGAGC